MMRLPSLRLGPPRQTPAGPHARQMLLLWLSICAGLVATNAVLATGDPALLPAVQSPLASHVLLTDTARAGQRIVAVGAYGNIIHSDDEGADWQQAGHVPTQVLLTTVHFVDDRRGWAAGHDSRILRTVDGGRNWETVYENLIPHDDVPKPILDVYFSDPLNGIAVGAFSFVLITADGGSHWEEVDTAPLRELLRAAGREVEPVLNAIAPLADGFLIAGELGTLVHYRPDSPSDEEPADQWRVLNSPYEGSYFGVDSSDPDDLHIYGLRGHWYRSHDSGQTWHEVTTNTTANLYDLVRIDNGDLVIVGAGGFIARLPPGQTRVEQLPYDEFDGFVSVQRTSDGRLLLFGDTGVQGFSLPETP